MEYVEVTKTLLSEPWFIAACIGDLAMIIALVWCYRRIKNINLRVFKIEDYQIETLKKLLLQAQEDMEGKILSEAKKLREGNDKESLLSPPVAAEFLGISVATLLRGKIKIPSQVVKHKNFYRMQDLIEAKKVIKKRKPYVKRNHKNKVKKESTVL